MDSNVFTALIGAGSSVLVAVTALVLNYRGFSSIDARFASLEASINSRFSSIDNRFGSIDNRFGSLERRLDMLQSDMKDLNKAMSAVEVDVAFLKDKAGMK